MRAATYDQFDSLRIYPQAQDTGGFFVAVLQKATDAKPKADTKTPLEDLPSIHESKEELIHEVQPLEASRCA